MLDPASLIVGDARRWRGWAVTAILWLAVAVGLVGGALGVLRPPIPAAPRADAADLTEKVPPSPAVTGAAEWAVRMSLSASSDNSVSGVIVTPARRPRSVDRVAVDSVTAIAARLVDEDYWAVTVAAVVRDGAEAGPMAWFLEVGVADTPDGPAVVADPALVPSPSTAAARVELAGNSRPADRSDPAADTVISFLTALLSGDPSVGRWTAPGYDTSSAVAAGTFETIRVEKISVDVVDDATRRSRADVEAVTPSGAAVVVSYEVVVVVRGGRWEVTSVSGAPTIALIDGGTPGREGVSSTVPAAAPPSTAASAPPEGRSIAPAEGSSANPYLYEEEEN